MGLFRKKPALVEDPVCGMMVDPAGAVSVGHADHVHYFCSESCKRTFESGGGHGH